MKLRTIVVGVSLSAAVLAGPAVHAQVVQNTIPLVLHADQEGGFSAVFGNTYGADMSGSRFIDTFTFTVDHPDKFTVTGSLIAPYINLAPPPGQTEWMSKYMTIRNFNLYDYDPATGTVGTQLSVPTSYYSGSFGGAWDLTPGSYAVQVRGEVNGNHGGMYSADLAIMQVPEPGAWGMLVAGLAALAAIARRRPRLLSTD